MHKLKSPENFFFYSFTHGLINTFNLSILVCLDRFHFSFKIIYFNQATNKLTNQQ